MIHQMNLHATPFEMIERGIKTIELRLYDEKRRLIKVGDEIVFTHSKDSTRTLHCRVMALHIFSSFEELYNTLPLLKCGYTEDDIDTAKEFASNMEERRSSIMISIFDIKKMMWYLEKKEDPWYRETLKNYYQELTQKLFDYQCAINEATPLTLKLASKYALNYRGYEEKRAAKTIELVSGGRDEVSDEDLAVLGKEADGFLSNPLDSVDYLIKKHDLEDVRNMPEISRGPRRKHR